MLPVISGSPAHQSNPSSARFSRTSELGTPLESRPPIAILGVPFDSVSIPEALHRIESMIASGRPHYIATANIDFVVQAMSDIELRRILCEADMVLCDGTPLVWAAQLLGHPLPERVAGSDLVPLLVHEAAQNGYRIFFLGGRAETTAEAVARLKAQHPALNLVGHYSPEFSPLLEMDHEEIQRRIERARPDLLFVCFGCPKQEKWMAMHHRALGVPVSMGVGGTIDFLAGRLARAPLWMQRSGTEWIFRLAQEPRRLIGRYARDLALFAGPFLRQCLKMRCDRASRHLGEPPNIIPTHGKWRQIEVPACFDKAAAVRLTPAWEQCLDDTPDLLLELDRVRFIDSTGIGALIRLRKHSSERSGQIVLVAASDAVKDALRLMRIEPFFLQAPHAAAALELLHTLRLMDRGARIEERAGEFCCQGELTAANAPEIWCALEHFIERNNHSAALAINLTQLSFIDSSGLSVLIRARKRAQQMQLRLQFIGVQHPVLNVIRLARLENFLLREAL
jgi:N-acetylglucosaminyldiphosphoundecaprenol N-acetyl-beta-D-mannosaminyltransferase